MTPLRMLSLCSGIGGADLAAVMTGQIEIVGQIEIDPFCLQVLEKEFPGVTRMTDIRKVRGDEFGAVDIVVGGIPCQPFSIAGNRRGTADDRYLWPAMLSIVEVAQPTYVIVENVAEFVNLALDTVQADLEGRGYEARAFVLPACALGTSHIRERVFLVAYSGSNQRRNWTHQQERRQLARTPDTCIHGESQCMAHTTSDGRNQRRTECQEQRRTLLSQWSSTSPSNMAHTNGTGQQELDIATVATGPRNNAPGIVALVEDSTSARQQIGDAATWTHHEPDASGRGASECGMDRGDDGIPDWLDRSRFPAFPDEPQHAWEPARTITRKQPNRNKRIKALGNAIVPQQIYPLFHYIVEIENEYRGYKNVTIDCETL